MTVITRKKEDECDPRDPLTPIKLLGEALHVPPVRLVTLERYGIVKFEWRRMGQWPGRVGRMSWFIDIPLYDCTEAGRLIGVCGRTVRRWRDANLIKTGKVGYFRRPRITPREVFRVKRQRDALKAGARPPSLEASVKRARPAGGGRHGR